MNYIRKINSEYCRVKYIRSLVRKVDFPINETIKDRRKKNQKEGHYK